MQAVFTVERMPGWDRTSSASAHMARSCWRSSSTACCCCCCCSFSSGREPATKPKPFRRFRVQSAHKTTRSRPVSGVLSSQDALSAPSGDGKRNQSTHASFLRCKVRTHCQRHLAIAKATIFNNTRFFRSAISFGATLSSDTPSALCSSPSGIDNTFWNVFLTHLGPGCWCGGRWVEAAAAAAAATALGSWRRRAGPPAVWPEAPTSRRWRRRTRRRRRRRGSQTKWAWRRWRRS